MKKRFFLIEIKKIEEKQRRIKMICSDKKTFKTFLLI
jgi:hypothetical protein